MDSVLLSYRVRLTFEPLKNPNNFSNLCNSFLILHYSHLFVDRQRSEDELKEMDRNNKIKGDTVRYHFL